MSGDCRNNDLTVKRIYSLKGRNVFREVYQKGRKIRGNGVRLFVVRFPAGKNATTGGSGNTPGDEKRIRIAIALTRSFGKAHDRNRAKRRIRSICTGMLHYLKDGFCIIIRIDSDYKNLAYEEEKRIITGLFERAGLLHNDAHTIIQSDNQ
ncbi:MAG: ribonuclease P protein component [Chrysiogenales bacterium]|nr:MAG: ribonuclease P protein component [Chrysiogenales bacterium]